MIKKVFSILIIFSLLSIGVSLAEEKISTEEIIDAYIKAIGGIDAIKSISSKKMIYKVHTFGFGEYLMESIKQRPNKLRVGRPDAKSYRLTEGERN